MHNTRAVGSMCEVELILLIGNDVGQNLGMNSCLPSASVSSVLMVILIFFCLHPSLYLLVS